MDFLLILAFLFAALEALAQWKSLTKLEYLVKPAVVICLFLWLSLKAGLQGALLWFGVGLLFSLAGDVFLMFMDRFFMLGLVSFLLAHVAYLVGFNIPAPQTLDIWSLGMAVVVGLGAARLLRRILAGVRARGQNRLVIPVAVYSGVITLMLLSALLTLSRPDWKANAALLASAGAFLFYLSDIVLAWNRFVSPLRHGRMLNIGIYHLAQIAITIGVVMQFSA